MLSSNSKFTIGEALDDSDISDITWVQVPVPRVCVPQVYTFLYEAASGDASPFCFNTNSNSPSIDIPLHVTVYVLVHLSSLIAG